MSTNSSSSVATPTPMGVEVPPVGFRFHPTDQELINGHLGPKIRGLEDSDTLIAEVEVCKTEPWDLPELSKIRSKDRVWYFFCPRQCKFKKSNRSNRTTEKGYWKLDGKPRQIRAKHSKNVIGSKRTLVFHLGRPIGTRTKWVMHEYECSPCLTLSNQGDFVLCKLQNKSDEKDTISDACCQTASNFVTKSHEMANYSSHDIPGSNQGACFGWSNENQHLCVSRAIGELVDDDACTNSMENSYRIDFNSTSPSISNYLQTLSKQSLQIPLSTPQTSHNQLTASLPASDTSLIANGTSQYHYQGSYNAEVISIEPEKQTNTMTETFSSIPLDSFHISEILGVSQVPGGNGIDQFSSISPPGNARFTHEFSRSDSLVVSDFGYRNLDDRYDISASAEVEKSPSLATPSTDIGRQNQYDNSDLDGLMASDLESKNEKLEEFSAHIGAWPDLMLEQVRVNSPLWMLICSEELPSSLLPPLDCDLTFWSLPLWD